MTTTLPELRHSSFGLLIPYYSFCNFCKNNKITHNTLNSEELENYRHTRLTEILEAMERYSIDPEGILPEEWSVEAGMLGSETGWEDLLDLIECLYDVSTFSDKHDGKEGKNWFTAFTALVTVKQICFAYGVPRPFWWYHKRNNLIANNPYDVEFFDPTIQLSGF